MKSFKTAAILILLIFFSPLVWADIPDISSYEKEIYRHFSRGNDFLLYKSIEKMLIRFPDHPVSTLYYEDLNRMAHVRGAAHVEKTIRTMIKTIRSGKMTGDRNLCLLKLNLELEKALYPVDRDRALIVTGGLHPVRVWRLAGPFSKFGPGDMEHVFMPEINGKLERNEGGYRSIVLKNDRGIMRVNEHAYPQSGAFYAAVTVAHEGPFKIRVYSEAYYTLFINGKKVLENRRKALRNLRVVSISGARAYTINFKLRGAPPGNLRLILTDMENRVIKNPAFEQTPSVEECEASPEEEFPFYYMESIKGADPARAFSMLGSYYLELGSRKSASCFKKSLALRNDPVTAFLLASALLRLNGGDRGSAWYLEGWRRLNRLSRENTGFIPASAKIFSGSVKAGNNEKAMRMGKDLYKNAPFYMPGLMEYMGLLNSLGYDAEFLKVVETVKKRFPSSVYPLLYEIEYYRRKNRDRYIMLCGEILKKKLVPDVVRGLIRVHLSAGEYDMAGALIEKYNYNREYSNDAITMFIRKGDYGNARKLLLKRIAERDVPLDYFNMGMISFLTGSDPLMYWLKLYRMDPSRFTLAEYIDYLDTGKIKNPFSAFSAPVRMPPGTWPGKELAQFPSTVLFHGRTFLLGKNRSSRVFCEEIVYVKNEKGIERWGDYHVPFTGKFHPVRIRVYRKNGEYSDSYSINRINNSYYININALGKDSILCISYIIDNPVRQPGHSAFFSTPFMYIQNYEEPVRKASIRVIAPAEYPLKFQISGKQRAEKTIVDDRAVYSVDLKNLGPVYYERNSGSGRNSLPFYSFSTMTSFSDFSAWYRGISIGTDILPPDADMKRFSGSSVEESIGLVYDFVSRKIDLQKNIIYYPEDAENTLYVRKGTPEDKVILAKSILSRKGIKSYTAFVKPDTFPDFSSFITPGMFTNILLYVPIDMDRALWLDFSDRNFPCGTVDPGLAGQDALVLLNRDSELVRVKSSEAGIRSHRYRIIIDRMGNASCDITAEFRGFYSWYRQRFRRKKDREKNINAYFGKMIPAMAADSYEVKNLDNMRSPFTLSVKGLAPALAVTGVNRMILQPVQNKCGVYRYIRYSRRNHPLILSAPISEREEYSYTLPPEYSRDRIQKDQEIKNRFGHARLRIIKDKNSTSLLVYKDIYVRSMRVLPGEYNEFLRFCMEIKKIEYQNISIKKN